ncbi:urease accessory protein [Moniliophthora roreri MCA 2997]|uniref:Urease accessory protein n=2 Tax=Moniliophthora roreri TaxID=221103 RepID=V2XT92_MONRO|nr:urease accessory protein [Moniliophthora roreri MCA 2997]KAI3610807.1 urease accessory protein [Moniliophthora roreri]
MTPEEETYILLLLADSNLPTGSFVASSGLESYFAHGYTGTIPFLRDSIASYARSALPFASDAHRAISDESALQRLVELDLHYEAMTLNHVTRRASQSQGVALLTLYSKSFASDDTRMANLVTDYKLMIRREQAPGHLPVCWGILTGALGLTLDRSQYLYVFLHARSLLSASVRLNNIGPYNAQHILLHVAKPIVEAEVARCRNLRTGTREDETDGPANVWPLGEIIASRHDLQHSRIFNS